MKLTGAQIFFEMLKLYKIEHVFGLPGETTLSLYKYWSQYPEIKHILTHDERNAAFMAEAYAKVTGRIGISEAPSPGGAHPAPGVLESQYSSVPTICFTSDVPWNKDKRNMLSGFDQNDNKRKPSSDKSKRYSVYNQASIQGCYCRKARRSPCKDTNGCV